MKSDFVVVVGQRVPIYLTYNESGLELCRITWKCRWYFTDDKSRPRGFRVIHKFKKPGIYRAIYHIKNKFDGSRMDGYATVEVRRDLS